MVMGRTTCKLQMDKASYILYLKDNQQGFYIWYFLRHHSFLTGGVSWSQSLIKSLFNIIPLKEYICKVFQCTLAKQPICNCGDLKLQIYHLFIVGCIHLPFMLIMYIEVRLNQGAQCCEEAVTLLHLKVRSHYPGFHNQRKDPLCTHTKNPTQI